MFDLIGIKEDKIANPYMCKLLGNVRSTTPKPNNCHRGSLKQFLRAFAKKRLPIKAFTHERTSTPRPTAVIRSTSVPVFAHPLPQTRAHARSELTMSAPWNLS